MEFNPIQNISIYFIIRKLNSFIFAKSIKSINSTIRNCYEQLKTWKIYLSIQLIVIYPCALMLYSDSKCTIRFNLSFNISIISARLNVISFELNQIKIYKVSFLCNFLLYLFHVFFIKSFFKVVITSSGKIILDLFLGILRIILLLNLLPSSYETEFFSIPSPH